MPRRYWTALAPMLAVACLSCSSSSNDEYYSGGGSPDAGSGTDATIVLPPEGGSFPETGASDADSDKPPLLYAHDDKTLYSINPDDPSFALTTLGTFDCVGAEGQDPSMTDLAVDKDGNLYGVSASTIYLNMEVDTAHKTVYCNVHKVPIDASSAAGDAHFYGLTIAPPTDKLGQDETLIGANSNGDLYAINRHNGALTLVGTFGKVPANDGQGHTYAAANVGKRWELSGDIVFLNNNGSPVGFATLRDCPNPPYSSNCSRIDTLAEIDVSRLAPVTGSGQVPIVTRAIRGQILPTGCTTADCGFDSMYGVAALQDKVYGFSRKGFVVEINNSNGVGVKKASPLSSSAASGFAGAGVTTLAPVIVPVPR